MQISANPPPASEPPAPQSITRVPLPSVVTDTCSASASSASRSASASARSLSENVKSPSLSSRRGSEPESCVGLANKDLATPQLQPVTAPARIAALEGDVEPQLAQPAHVQAQERRAV